MRIVSVAPGRVTSTTMSVPSRRVETDGNARRLGPCGGSGAYGCGLRRSWALAVQAPALLWR
jgi:hypothetical protein